MGASGRSRSSRPTTGSVCSTSLGSTRDIPQFASTIRPASLEDIRAHLRPDEMLIEIVAYANRYGAFLLTRTGDLRWADLGPASAIDRPVQDLIAAANDWGVSLAGKEAASAKTSEQTAQDDLTPKQVANENKIYIKWRVCMIGRGWVVPPPKPDAKGALLSFGASGGSGPQLTPPPGESLLSSPDIQACVALAQKGRT